MIEIIKQFPVTDHSHVRSVLLLKQIPKVKNSETDFLLLT